MGTVGSDTRPEGTREVNFRVNDRHGNEFEVELPRLVVGDATRVDIGGDSLPVAVSAFEGDSLTVEVSGRRYVFTVTASLNTTETAHRRTQEGKTIELLYRNRPYRLVVSSEIDRLRARTKTESKPAGPVVLYSALPGVVRQVFVAEGAEVTEGTPILTLEAMKMENEVRAEITGRVEALFVAPGDVVAARQELARISPA